MQPMSWRLSISGGATRRSITPRLRLFSDDPDTLVEAALAGLGIAALPRCICAQHLQRGMLVRMLPDWIAGGATTTLLVPHRRGQMPAVRAIADALVTALRARLEGPLPLAPDLIPPCSPFLPHPGLSR